MKEQVELHLRSHPLGSHRNLGLVAVEHEEPDLHPAGQIVCEADGRRLQAHVTSIHKRGDHLPHVYADELAELEPA